ncbi:hypothetical protein CEXT_550301 [Caerostris extrusa]|uniref:Uncharacterized protein n=1 Tax=Caerostris extrusa TaxID=172846 RepID=A0AAV4MB32_CAEEX|nr:hypothetical protein CEXT_550301 [Caerostris extrusa]
MVLSFPEFPYLKADAQFRLKGDAAAFTLSRYVCYHVSDDGHSSFDCRGGDVVALNIEAVVFVYYVSADGNIIDFWSRDKGSLTNLGVNVAKYAFGLMVLNDVLNSFVQKNVYGRPNEIVVSESN